LDVGIGRRRVGPGAVYGRCVRVTTLEVGRNGVVTRVLRPDPGGIVLKAIDPEDLELLKTIADGTTNFHPVQDEPSDSPRWVGQVERLCRLEREGLIRMPEPETGDQPGYPAGVGPCQLTTEGRKALEKAKA
jgi:hypothetical protein